MKKTLARILFIVASTAFAVVGINAQEYRGAVPGLIRYVKDGKVKESSLKIVVTPW